MKKAQDWIDRLDEVHSERDQQNWVEAIQADAIKDQQERLAALSACLRDVITLFDQADKSPAEGGGPICTGDRREMWEEVLKRYGTP